MKHGIINKCVPLSSSEFIGHQYNVINKSICWVTVRSSHTLQRIPYCDKGLRGSFSRLPLTL